MPNPEIISQSKEPDIDKNNWKILLLGFLIAASGFVSFLLLDKFLAGFNYAQLALFVVVSCGRSGYLFHVAKRRLPERQSVYTE